jgi:hypothetical protein
VKLLLSVSSSAPKDPLAEIALLLRMVSEQLIEKQDEDYKRPFQGCAFTTSGAALYTVRLEDEHD